MSALDALERARAAAHAVWTARPTPAARAALEAACRELTAARRAAQPAESEAAIAARLAERLALERERTERRALAAAVTRARREWAAGQDWPQCGQGLPADWRGLLPSAAREDPRLPDVIRQLDSAQPADGWDD